MYKSTKDPWKVSSSFLAFREETPPFLQVIVIYNLGSCFDEQVSISLHKTTEWISPACPMARVQGRDGMHKKNATAAEHDI